VANLIGIHGDGVRLVSIGLRQPSAARPVARVRRWVRAGELLADQSALVAWVDEYGAALGAPSTAVAAALACKCYTWDVLEPVVTGWVLRRRVLDASAAHTHVRPGPSGVEAVPAVARYTVLPGDGLAGRPGVTVVATENELLSALRSTLIDGHLAPAVEAFRAIRGGGARPLWGSVAQSLCYPVTIADVPDRHADVRALLSILDPEVAGLVEVAEVGEGRPVLLRRTCCYAYALPSGELCRSCCLHDETSQNKAFADAGQTLRRLAVSTAGHSRP
jgi:ferric iron reductase protein FhuF